MSSRIILVRHGDRFDFANPDWVTTAQTLGLNPRDPPLSALGERQAWETVAFLADEVLKGLQPACILVSPYLRVIETAQPLARRLQVSLKIDDLLSETHHLPGTIISPLERFAYFPEIDVNHSALHEVVADGLTEKGVPCEQYPKSYFSRMRLAAKLLTEKFAGQTVVCFSHAASVALIAAILDEPLTEDLRFAPCGVFLLEKGENSSKWVMRRNGGSNAPFVSQNSATGPWGFSKSDRDTWNEGRGENWRASL